MILHHLTEFVSLTKLILYTRPEGTELQKLYFYFTAYEANGSGKPQRKIARGSWQMQAITNALNLRRPVKRQNSADSDNEETAVKKCSFEAKSATASKSAPKNKSAKKSRKQKKALKKDKRNIRSTLEREVACSIDTESLEHTAPIGSENAEGTVSNATESVERKAPIATDNSEPTAPIATENVERKAPIAAENAAPIQGPTTLSTESTDKIPAQVAAIVQVDSPWATHRSRNAAAEKWATFY